MDVTAARGRAGRLIVGKRLTIAPSVPACCKRRWATVPPLRLRAACPAGCRVIVGRLMTNGVPHRARWVRRAPAITIGPIDPRRAVRDGARRVLKRSKHHRDLVDVLPQQWHSSRNCCGARWGSDATLMEKCGERRTLSRWKDAKSSSTRSSILSRRCALDGAKLTRLDRAVDPHQAMSASRSEQSTRHTDEKVFGTWPLRQNVVADHHREDEACHRVVRDGATVLLGRRGIQVGVVVVRF